MNDKQLRKANHGDDGEREREGKTERHREEKE